jgi:iron(II)-dependent oxidoreductase
MVDRESLVEWYVRNRRRSQAIFDVLADEDTYYSQPIALRHPIVFYEGHLPAFSFNTLVKNGLGGKSIDPALEQLFARGIDPVTAAEAANDPETHLALWPGRREVQSFAHEADRRVVEALRSGDIERPGHPLLDRADAAFTILEHEAMHQETLLYMWHRLPLTQKRRPADADVSRDARVPAQEWMTVDAGTATLGVARQDVRFGWDNEFPAHREPVASFEMQQHNVTNSEYMDFVDAGGYDNPAWWRPADWAWRQEQRLGHPLFWERHDAGWYWRGMFELLPLPQSWPVYVSHAEATAYARWRDARLPTEAEYQRAAYGMPGDGERPLPWGEAAPVRAHGVFDFVQWDPAPAGSHPQGRSAWGVDDLVGNGWEWTSTTFAPFPGFRAMATYPQYSADFFDGDHFVMKGASPATARELLRPSFRNWFRPHYPYVYATFRCVRDSQ